MNTLPPEQQVSRDVPVVTADGATSAAYKDPNSPESIMRRAKTAEVQAAVDSKYDTNVNPYEGFCDSDCGCSCPLCKRGIALRLSILLLLLVLVYAIFKTKNPSLRILFVSFVAILVVLTFAPLRSRRVE